MIFNANLSDTEIGNSPHHIDNNNKDLFDFDNVFSRVWKVLFTPSPPIQDILRSMLAKLDLVPNEYVSSHLRALYGADSRPTWIIQKFTQNALACATEIFPGAPIFFASDSTIALEHAQEYNGKESDLNDGADGGRSLRLRVVTTATKQTPPNPPDSAAGEKNASTVAISQPWHLDSFVGPIENFYDTFVDLYLLAMARCVTYSKGGYGHWGMLIGGNTHCAKRQTYINKRFNETADFCKFRSNTIHQDTDFINKNYHSVFGLDDSETGPTFLPPMD